MTWQGPRTLAGAGAPFDYPARPLDRLLAAAAQGERGLRHLARQRGRLRLPVVSGGPGAARGVRPAGATSPGAGGGEVEERLVQPLLYLPALPWSYRYQRPQQLAVALAAHHPVLYVDGFRRTLLQPTRRARCLGDGGLWCLELAIPGRPDPFRQPLGAAAAAALADTIATGLRAAPRAVIAQLPFWQPLARELARRFQVPLVYDRIDLHAGFPGVPAEIAAAEEELLAAADLVTVTSPGLDPVPGALDAGTGGAPVLLLPNAVALDDFPFRPSPPSPEAAPEALTVGYVGALHEWFDSAAVAAAARRQPGWRFLLAGRVESSRVAQLAALPNVELLGEIPYNTVAALLARLDVALVPFRDLPLTRAVDPVKLYEALAVGVPVVARRLPGVAGWEPPLVWSYDAGEELAGAIAAARAGDGPEARRSRRQRVEQETWQQRAAALLAALPEPPGGAPSPARTCGSLQGM